ncbi:neprilysin-2-like [Chironomus tepperi]|uniref:neprilysin-2-like n=1 Tax=Chironomus tepperi TaxID=113505 RepID=UPI00391EF1B7
MKFLYIGIFCCLHAVINASRTIIKEKVPTTTESAEHKKNELQVCIDAGKVCLSPGCIHAASNMLQRMDKGVNPCDDFYKFSCGQFVENTIIPDDKVFVNTFNIVGDKLQEQLRIIISSSIEDNEIEPFKMVKKLYLACMDESQIDDRGLMPLIDIQEKIGGWPMVIGDKWDKSEWIWQCAVKALRQLGFSTDYLIDFSVDTDLRNSTRRIINIDQTDFGLDIEYLRKGINDSIVQAYLNYQIDIAVLFGADRERAEKEAMDVVQFEIELANISLTNDKRRDADSFYNPITIKELNVKHPYLDWLAYFNNLLPQDAQVTDDEVILIYVPSFFDQFGTVIEKTPKRTIANYLAWRMTQYSVKFMTTALRKRQLKFTSSISGQEEEEPRWKECIDTTTSSLKVALSSMYVRKYFDPVSKKNALDMVDAIKKEFEEILKKVSWMGDETRKAALVKVKKMYTNVGYPDELIGDQKIIDFYKSVNVDDKKYLESILSINEFETDREFQKLREAVNKTDWVKQSNQAQVNAFYSSLENSIKFPAGILQGQFYSADRPQYMNYAAIGSIIGHEITHGFDDRGRQFDADGNLVGWWDDDTIKAYSERAQCMIEQYGNFTEPVTKLNLNGVKTQGENIADNGGIKEAYLAYQKIQKERGEEPKLPGLNNYSINQLFWISAAQTWCSVYRPATLRAYIIAVNHPPSPYRVLGPLSNMKEFSKDFNCLEGSPMNPVHKCEVW